MTRQLQFAPFYLHPLSYHQGIIIYHLFLIYFSILALIPSFYFPYLFLPLELNNWSIYFSSNSKRNHFNVMNSVIISLAPSCRLGMLYLISLFSKYLVAANLIACLTQELFRIVCFHFQVVGFILIFSLVFVNNL